MFNDEYLEHRGVVYVVARLLEPGIVICEFLEDPWRSLKAAGLALAPLYERLALVEEEGSEP